MGLLRCLQVGGGGVFGLTASKLSWSTFKGNSYNSFKNILKEITSVSSRRGQQIGI
jgi:hypothetical protein